MVFYVSLKGKMDKNKIYNSYFEINEVIIKKKVLLFFPKINCNFFTQVLFEINYNFFIR